MKKILIVLLLSLTLYSTIGNAQWGTQPWNMNPWGRGAFQLGPWGSASTPTVTPGGNGLEFLGSLLQFLGSQLTFLGN